MPTTPVFLRNERTESASQHESLMHSHAGIELVQVTDGHMDCQVNESVNHLGPGDVCLINGSRMHRAQGSGNEHCSYRVMVLDPRQLTRDEAVFEHYIAPILDNDKLDFMLGTDCKGTAGEVCKLMDQIEELQAKQPPAFELEVIALAHLVFKQIYLRCTANNMLSGDAVSPDTLLQRRMTAFIYEHYGEHISVDDIAHAGGVSRSKCSAVFRSELDTSPIEFLNRYRLEVAAELLARTENTVAQISRECGFSQQSYFNRVFLREYGCTPKEYRKQHRVA